MREHHIPLFGLESRDPIGTFDFIGFTLQYEMSYTAVLDMLDLAGVPLRAADRGEDAPIVVAGGKKLPEKDALTLAYDVMQKGAHGVDMGRNIFQSNHPVEMAKAIRMIVHHNATDKEAFQFYTDAINSK